MFSCEFCELFKNIYFKEHLREAGSKIPVLGFLFNKVASLTAWTPLKVLERDSSTLFCEFSVLFRRTPPSNHFSHDVIFIIIFLLFNFADQ